ncbi:MAG: DNA repair protein RadC [Syntrophobacterales bacterium]|jgi:DNA repair protein RadC|nr:DNA repair protein RadC [Syntrophobacterales bacterium]
MVEKPAKPHYHGHRARLRQRFLTGGPGALQDYELLELLLTFAIPYSDVKPLAKRLIEHFGSFNHVFDAAPEAIMEVTGLKEYSAVLIKLVKACSEYTLKAEALKRQQINSLATLVDYCRASMGGLPDEQFRVIFLNSQNEIIAEEIVQEGTVNQTVVYPRKVLELALKHKASGLILVHNHPSGHLNPSAADQELTRALVKASRALNLTVHDHLIIGRHGYFSLAEKDML